ncbi:MAG: helix-turn-helix domain-containing protein, partial [Rhodobacteraceae bacterium]|nr:helix-turn-helix domain-containing protein [Paracoccaceae bacterium]
MIGRRANKATEDQEPEGPKGFDDFELKLGDVLRGERATHGKSLLDVQRELRIKASYIAAIENCDPHAFDTPGFIAGYVRSYARYLNLDPDDTFRAFCEESGFAVAHGMSAEASSLKKSSDDDRIAIGAATDIFADPKTPFVPAGSSVWSGIEPGAIGSSLVLVALIGAIGFGGWTVLQEIQRVQVAPVDQTPVVLSNLDPLDNVPVADGGVD